MLLFEDPELVPSENCNHDLKRSEQVTQTSIRSKSNLDVDVANQALNALNLSSHQPSEPVFWLFVMASEIHPMLDSVNQLFRDYQN